MLAFKLILSYVFFNFLVIMWVFYGFCVCFRVRWENNEKLKVYELKWLHNIKKSRKRLIAHFSVYATPYTPIQRQECPITLDSS